MSPFFSFRTGVLSIVDGFVYDDFSHCVIVGPPGPFRLSDISSPSTVDFYYDTSCTRVQFIVVVYSKGKIFSLASTSLPASLIEVSQSADLPPSEEPPCDQNKKGSIWFRVQTNTFH